MKYVKMLGLVVMAAIALVALGEGSASAASSLYSTGAKVPAGSEFHATLENGTTSTMATTDGKTLVDTCSSGTISAKIEYPAGGDAKGSISSLTGAGARSQPTLSPMAASALVAPAQ